MTETVEVIEFTDPGCAWSWGSEPIMRWLARRYEGRLRWRRVFGVQLDGPAGADVGEAPEELREGWLAIAEHTSAPVAERLERGHASTRPAALAAKAAELQGAAAAEAVLRRLREAFFVVGRPPDTPSRIFEAIEGLPSVDAGRLLEDLESDAVAAALELDWGEARRPHQDVILLDGEGPHPGGAKRDGETQRYAFPTVVARGPGGERVVPGWRAPHRYRDAVEAVAPSLARARESPPDPSAALERYRSVTAWDLTLLTGGQEARPEAVLVQTATSPLWLHREEAVHIENALAPGVSA
jgi:predicted DsbA family dithiol-disulfide isomerase